MAEKGLNTQKIVMIYATYSIKVLTACIFTLFDY